MGDIHQKLIDMRLNAIVLKVITNIRESNKDRNMCRKISQNSNNAYCIQNMITKIVIYMLLKSRWDNSIQIALRKIKDYSFVKS